MTHRKIESRIGAFAALIAVSLSALAQTAPTPTEPVTLDKVIITGSHIRAFDAETALPVQVIKREEIDRSGVTTVEQLLERIPGNLNGINAAMSIGSETPGLSSANLRGLGGGSTLVLLNGRRLANYAFVGDTVDLNSIPLAAVDRVEVLKDGASAIYGSDAIAGVINFILRRDFVGAELTAYGALTQGGGGNSGLVVGSVGHGDPARDGYNVFLSASYQKDQALKAIDRDFARTAYRPEIGLNRLSPGTFPANILAGRDLLNPTYPQGCTPPTSLPLPPAECGYDYMTAIDILPAVERASVLARGTLRLSADADLFAEALYSRNQFNTTVSPTPVSPFTIYGPNLYPAGGPYYPSEFAAANGLSGDLALFYRSVELGPRINDVDSDAQRYAIGVEGVARGWDYNVAAVYSRNTQTNEYANGYVYASKLIPAMATGLINPFGPSGPEGQALLASTLFHGTLTSTEGTTSLVNASASREIATIPAGPLLLALGAEARREKLTLDWEPILLSGSSFTSDTPLSVAGSRNVYALFAELNVPIVRGLDAQLAVRYDDYSDFGSTTNPKFALRWQPLQSLLMRASWGTGFRAPPLYDLHRPPFTGGDFGISDPARCPVTGLPDDCDVFFFEITEGGNPNLQPETSTQWNAGIVWEPARGLTLGIDYWNIEQKNIISALGPQNAVLHYDKFDSRFIRGPVDPNYPNLPGPIIGFDNRLLNLGTTQTSGIDVSLAWTAPRVDWGLVSVALQATYVMQWDTQFDGVVFVSQVGTDAYGPVIPRWRSQLTLNWNNGPWGATLAQTYTAGYTDFAPGPSGEPHEVGAFAPWDLQGTYSGFSGWQFVAGIRNLFDSDPPASNQPFFFQSGYNPQIASPLGRLFYLRATYSWR